MNTMTESETALYNECGFLMCPKCGAKMRPMPFDMLIQGWDDITRQAVKVQYTGDRSKPTHTVEEPPQSTPSEIKIIGSPAIGCHRCNLIKIPLHVAQSIDWARRHLIPARSRDTVPWEVVKHAMAEQQHSAEH